MELTLDLNKRYTYADNISAHDTSVIKDILTKNWFLAEKIIEEEERYLCVYNTSSNDIVLATKPINKSDYITNAGLLRGNFAKELNYLVQKGYKPINLTDAEWNTINIWFK